MVLGSHMVLCMTAKFFENNNFAPKIGKKRTSVGFFECVQELIYVFSIWSLWRFVLIAVCLGKSQILKNFGFWDMVQNAAGQSDCRIVNSTISPQQNDEKAWFFAWSYKLNEIKSCFKNIGVGMVVNGCKHSGPRTLKLAVSHKEINRINWFLSCWYKFR